MGELVSMSRTELVQLALSLSAGADQPTATQQSPQLDVQQPDFSINTTSVSSSSPSHDRDARRTLDVLDRAPQLDAASSEITRRRSSMHAISDDVNGLSVSLDTASSYVGLSSVSAALRAIFKVAPQVQAHLAQHCPRTAQPSRAPSPSPSPAPSDECSGGPDSCSLPPPDVAERHIESYFHHIHPLMPMVDEDAFRHTFLYDPRMDASWLSLYNVVLALGSLASGTCESREHLVYARRARHILSQRSLGTNNILVLQAHGLLSGYYLHWLNRPNEAHAMMGATMRIASAVGLHREYDTSSSSSQNKARIPPEVRRRTWWSLVCLDTWASMTTGRPSFGRLGPGITVGMPSLPPSNNNKQYLASLKLLPLAHNLAFCKIATPIQDLLSENPLLTHEQLNAEDSKLVEWHENLPPILRCTSKEYRERGSQPQDICPNLLQTPRAIMHWWFLTLRILMYRPYLIATSLCRVSKADIPEQDKHAVQKCQLLAGEAILVIDQTCQQTLIAGWNAVWLMYQAVMVPILSLSALYTSEVFMQTHNNTTSASDNPLSTAALEWQNQVETVIRFFGKMSEFSLAAARSKTVVEQLLHACTNISPSTSGSSQNQALPLPTQRGSISREDGELFGGFDFRATGFDVRASSMNTMWDTMAWESMSGTLEDLPFAEAYPHDFDFTFEG